MEVNAAATQSAPQSWRNRVGMGNQARHGFVVPPLWFAGLSTLAFLTLLFAFNHVVRQGVQTAELRRQSAAAQSTAIWRCQMQHERQGRDDCLATIPGAAPSTVANGVTTAYASF